MRGLALGAHAEYVAVANEADTEADLSAWVSVDNQSGAAYPDTRLQLIAGDVHRVQPTPPVRPMMDRGMKGMVAQESAGFEEEYRGLVLRARY